MTTVGIATGEGTFTADVEGPASGELVILLHGFPQSRHSWTAEVAALAKRGYRAVAYDGRGYSPGVRPDPALGFRAYGMDRLVADVMDVAVAMGATDGNRFHLVGHDWGGQVAWVVAERHPDRLASLTVLSRPHPAAFRAAYDEDSDGQRTRSRHHRAFHDPEMASRLLADDAKILRGMLAPAVPPPTIERYLEVLRDPGALDGALAWYRAAGTLAAIEVGPVHVPTLYLWGDADPTVGPTAAHATARFVPDLRFVTLPGLGHFLSDEDPAAVVAPLLDHLERHPYRTAT